MALGQGGGSTELLPFKHEDLSSTPECQKEKLGVAVAHSYNASPREVETDGSLGLLAS